MKTLDEIKEMMVAGDTAKAGEALKELLAAEPDNLQAKMLYGTCRQLLGDEETFKRIHDELAPRMERMEKKEPKAEAVSLWKKYHALWMTLIVGGLVLTGLMAATVYFGNEVKSQMDLAGQAMVGKTHYAVYAGPPREEHSLEEHQRKVAKERAEAERRALEARRRAEAEEARRRALEEERRMQQEMEEEMRKSEKDIGH